MPIGPPALPWVGHAPWFLRDKPHFLLDCHRRYGDVVRLQLGGPTFLVVAPADVRHILASHAENYGKSDRVTGTQARRAMGTNVLTVEGAAHRRLRRALRPWLHPSALEHLPQHHAARATRYAERWLSAGTIDVVVEARDLARDCVVAAVLGPSACDRFPQLGALLDARREYVEALFGLWPARLTRAAFHYPAAHRTLFRILDELLSGHLWNPRAGVSANAPTTTLGDEERREQLLALLLAGYETTAAMLAWTLYLLARSPEIQPSARSTSYAEQVIYEALRLYPPTWLFVRVARSADQLPSGAAIPAGAKIYLSQFVSHRQVTSFPDPEHFDPSRFAGGNPFDPFAYFPFGGGPRMCPGEGLAIDIGVSLVENLMRQLGLGLRAERPPRVAPRLTLQPAHPIHASVRRRSD